MNEVDDSFMFGYSIPVCRLWFCSVPAPAGGICKELQCYCSIKTIMLYRLIPVLMS